MRLAKWSACALLVLCSLQAHATWTLVQGIRTSSCTSTSSTCTVSFASGVTAGNLVFVWMSGSINDPLVTVTDNGTGGSSTYTVPAGCAAFESTTGIDVSCAYTLNASSGAVSITGTRGTTTGSSWNLRLAEFNSSVGEFFDATGTATSSVQTTAPVGPSLTLSGTNDLVLQFLRGSSPTAVTAPYTYVSGMSSAVPAYALNSSTAPAPTWTQTNFRASMNAVAFKESSGAVVQQPVIEIITQNRARAPSVRASH